MVGTRALNRLSAIEVEKAGAGRHADGGGLYLEVKPSGARSWLFVFRWGGKRPEIGLGAYPAVKLAHARAKAEAARQSLADGIDPRTARAGGVRETFGGFALAWLAVNGARWKNPKHRAQWQRTLEVHAAPIWNVPLPAVDTTGILKCLEPIWSETPETASRVRGRIETVLNAARAKGLRSGENPARWDGHLDHLLPPRRTLTRGHHRALGYRDAPAFVARLRAREAVAALALEWTILTAARTSETLLMTWVEIDGDVWTIPAPRMKSKRPHRVPLSGRCVEILAAARALGGVYVFPGADGAPLSSGAMERVLDRMGVAVTVHGFRSTFRDWAGDETEHPREIIEAALAHVIGDRAEQAYRRGDALERRRTLMEQWARYLAAGRPELAAK